MIWVVERLLEFKTVPPRWDVLTTHDSQAEAEQRVRELKPGGRAEGGRVTEFRVRFSN